MAEGSLDRLFQKIIESEQTEETAREEIASLRKQIQGAESELKSLNEYCTSSKGRIHVLVRQHHAEKAEYLVLSTQKKSLETQKNRLEQGIDNLKVELSEQNESISDIQSEYSAKVKKFCVDFDLTGKGAKSRRQLKIAELTQLEKDLKAENRKHSRLAEEEERTNEMMEQRACLQAEVSQLQSQIIEADTLLETKKQLAKEALAKGERCIGEMQKDPELLQLQRKFDLITRQNRELERKTSDLKATVVRSTRNPSRMESVSHMAPPRKSNNQFRTMDCNWIAYLGFASVSYIGLRILYDIYSGVKLYFLSAYPDFAKYGKWSVITGATDGIGKATARVLAQRGQNIVLISRNASKLQTVARDIQKDFNVETKSIRVDFTQDESIYEEIRQELADLDVGVLVNNMGISYPFPEYFLNIENLSTTILNMIRGNMLSTVKMVEVVLPGMVERKRGLILNLSSASALKPTPMLTLYSASKDFVNHFSQAIAYEYEPKGVKIQSVVPFYVATKLSKIRQSSLLVPSPDTYARSMLRGAGRSKFTYGYWAHGLEGWIIQRLPDWVYSYIMLQKGEAIRQKAYKKRQWQKENNSGEVKKEQ